MNNQKSTERSAKPMPGLSKRAQEQLRSRSFNVYARAKPKTIAPQAEEVIADQNRTPEQLEAAIKAQGALVEHHVSYGRREPASEAFAVVRRLVSLRTPETVAQMERERGLA